MISSLLTIRLKNFKFEERFRILVISNNLIKHLKSINLIPLILEYFMKTFNILIERNWEIRRKVYITFIYLLYSVKVNKSGKIQNDL